jgi:hypothetical protein
MSSGLPPTEELPPTEKEQQFAQQKAAKRVIDAADVEMRTKKTTH